MPPAPTLVDGRLTTLSFVEHPTVLPAQPEVPQKSQLEEKAAAVGASVASSAIKAGEYVYEKGKSAVAYATQKSSVTEGTRTSRVGTIDC